jgi:hypothetical protein
MRKSHWVQGWASREDVAPQSCCYRSKTVKSGEQHGLAHCRGGAAMCCSATDQVASFTHSPVDVSKFQRRMQHYLFDQEEQILCEQFPSDQRNKSTLT